MTLVTDKPTEQTDATEGKGRKVDRLPDRYITGADFVVERTEALDAQIARLLAAVQTGMDLKMIDPIFSAKLTVMLTSAFIDVTRIHNVVKLLRESGMEVQQREVERIEVVDKATEEFVKLLKGELKAESLEAANGVKKP